MACRRRADKAALLRLVAVSGSVTVDPEAVRPGRGAYLCDRPACLRRALDNNGTVVTRALRLPAGTATVDTDALRAARQLRPRMVHAPQHSQSNGAISRSE